MVQASVIYVNELFMSTPGRDSPFPYVVILVAQCVLHEVVLVYSGCHEIYVFVDS